MEERHYFSGLLKEVHRDAKTVGRSAYTNEEGTFLVTQSLLPLMMAAGGDELIEPRHGAGQAKKRTWTS